MITATRINSDKTRTNRTIITRKQKWEEKQLYGHFKRLISNISHEETWRWLRKGKVKRETKRLLQSTQNNAIKINHFKARIDKTHHTKKKKKQKKKTADVVYVVIEKKRSVSY